MTGPSVYFTLPSFTLSGLVPADLPHALPPPVKERSFRSPFGIDPWLFNAALRPEIPIIFAITYIITVFSLNAYNKKKGNRPWWIARQKTFNYFVVVHNALLTIYSLATFLAMCRAIVHSWPAGGFNNAAGGAGIADALCKMHGPRGLGDSATYNSTTKIWEVKNTGIRLGYDGNPDPTDVGRLWNEGLAFWGWMFYMSKFYEVLDTLIILAKGKRSATLQTYHHSGAMLCMWAGIRYMSPPIWMFVFVNSFIHALMYTYFTLAAVGVKVPTALKRTLTSMQIAQFLWGASYAAAHLFVKYDMPIATPYQVASTLQSAVSSVSSAATAATSTVSKVIASPAASGTLLAFAKKLLLRAVGEEGIAERVTNSYGDPITPHIEEKIEQFNKQSQKPIYETKWRTELTKVNCIDTSGEAFAIYLNLLYLAPLTFLFARFFVKAYTGRAKTRRASHAAKQITDSGRVAGERTSETVEKFGRKAEDEIINIEAELHKVDPKDIKEQMRRDIQAVKNGTFGDRRVSDRVEEFERQARSAAEKVKEQGKKAVNTVDSAAQVLKEEGKKFFNGADGAVDKVKDEGKQASNNAESAARKAKEKGKKSVKDSDKPESYAEAVKMDPETSSEQTQSTETTQTSSSSTFDKEEYSSSNAKTAGGLLDTGNAGQNADSESKQKQDANLEATLPTRPDPEEDTDAMGRSGAIVDVTASQLKEGREDAWFPKETKIPSPSRSRSQSPTKKPFRPVGA